MCFRVVNGALEYLSKDLGIADNTVLQGKFHSIYDDNCNYFTLLFFIRCVQVLCFQTRRRVLSVCSIDHDSPCVELLTSI